MEPLSAKDFEQFCGCQWGLLLDTKNQETNDNFPILIDSWFKEVILNLYQTRQLRKDI